jgi:predicted regulator of amino acid metabolism with ACT domain
MKKLLAKVLRIGRKKAIETLGDVVERLDWAQKEIEEAEEKLIELSHRLHNGVVELENAEKSSAAIIKRHQEILSKAQNRKVEFQAKGQKVIDLINTIHTDVK